MNLDEEGNTEELARLASQGDPDSVAALARRSISSLFDFAVRVTLDETTAKSVVESTLGRALGDPENRPPNLGFRAWLFGIARDEALDTMRARGREGAESGQLSPLDERFMHLDDQTRAPDMALWTWQAARAQRPRDYSLLDLALRRRLPPEEIADIASLSRSGIYAVLGRLRGAFEESFFTSTLYFRGRQHCPELDKLVTEATSLGPALRRDIGRHADGCSVCKETRNGLTLAADILGSFTNVSVPEELLERLVAAPVAIAEVIEDAEAHTLEDDVSVDVSDEVAGPDEVSGVDAAELAAVLPAVVALDGQTLEENEDVVAEELVKEAALYPPEVKPEPEPAVEEPAIAEAIVAAEPVAEVVEEELPAEDAEAPVAVPVAAGMAAVGAMTVLAAAEDALLAGSAATVVPHMPSVSRNGAGPANATAANGAEPIAAAGIAASALLPAVDLPGEGAQEPTPAFEDTLAPVEEPAEALASVAAPVVVDAGIEPAQATLAVADSPPDAVPELETSVEVPGDAAAEVADPETLVSATELTTPAADAIESGRETTAPETEATVVDDDGAVTAVDESTPVADSAGAGALVPLAAGAVAASGIAASTGAAGVQVAGGGGGQPPRARTAEGSEGGRAHGKRNVWLIGVIAVATVAAAYVGIALGDSIRSGGETPTQPGVVLPTRAPGVQEVACGTAPIAMQQGTRATLTFAAGSLPGYEVSAVAVQPISPTARTSSVEATAQQGLAVLFEAFTIPAVANQSTNLVDEYRLVVTFSRGQERTSSECTVLVSAGAIVPTNTPPAPTIEATQPPAPTPTQPAPIPTSVSIAPTQIVPTPEPSATPEPTQTPEPEAEPPTQTPVPTNTPVPPTNTPTVTGTPPTATPPPTYTPTITPSPTATPTSTPFVPPPAPLPES